jgi:hypothetical protein
MITELPSAHLPLTVEAAKAHAALPQIKGDRGLQKTRMEHLIDAHERGLFHSPEWAICYCKETGLTYRMNGKHSANFLMGLNGHFPKTLSVTIKRFECDSLSELAILFDQFDRSISVRTRGDSINVHKSLHGLLDKVSKTSVEKAVAGIAWYIKHVNGTFLSPADQAQLVHHYADFIAWQEPITGTTRMKRAGVVAAMFATWNANPTKAMAFWILVKDQSHEDSRGGSRVLGKFLELAQYNPFETSTKIKWDSRAFYVKSIHGWNAHVTNTTTDLKYHPNAPFPKVKG